ncbi:MAG: hypothetical protein AAF747_08610, partial [Planctomycetota bacterium]
MRYADRLIVHLGDDAYEPRTLEAIAEELRIADTETLEHEALDLARDGIVDIDSKGLVQLPSLESLGSEFVGTFKGTTRGFGFVTPEAKTRDGDVFIGPEDTGDALSGDKVRIGFRRDHGRERRQRDGKPSYKGWVLEVIERKRGAFAGEIFKQGTTWLVQPDGKDLTDPIVIRDATSKNVKEGDKVVVEIVEYPQDGALAEGVISKVLGEAGRP